MTSSIFQYKMHFCKEPIQNYFPKKKKKSKVLIIYWGREQIRPALRLMYFD